MRLIREHSCPYFKNYRITLFLAAACARPEATKLAKGISDICKETGLVENGRNIFCSAEIEPWKTSRNVAMRRAFAAGAESAGFAVADVDKRWMESDDF
jgi:hypothetical protein